MKLANESDNLNPKALDRIWEEEEMADWEDLDEFFKEGYRSRIRFLGEHLVQFDAVLGIRPIVRMLWTPFGNCTVRTWSCCRKSNIAAG